MEWMMINERDEFAPLSGLCTSQASVERLRKHRSHVTFLSKWNLSVYFQIRFQEIAGTFETALLEGWKRSEDKGTKVRTDSAFIFGSTEFSTCKDDQALFRGYHPNLNNQALLG